MLPPQHPARPAGGAPAPAPSGDADAEFLLDNDWDSEQEGECGRKRRGTDADSSLRHADSDSEGAARVKGAQVEEEDEYEPLQVIFCSRTHSQLAQVVGELSRTRFAARFRCVTLAGRAVMCVNEGVQALAPPAQRLNDRCRDLQAAARTRIAAKPAATSQPGKAARSKASAGCPFLAKRKGAVAALREHILHQPLEVEEVTRAGRTAGACPYYAARAALPAAHIVLLPYAALLQQEMRCVAFSLSHRPLPCACPVSDARISPAPQRGAGHSTERRGGDCGRGAQPARGGCLRTLCSAGRRVAGIGGACA